MTIEKTYNVVIVEADILTRITLKKMLNSLENYVVCADFDNAESAIDFIKSHRVDLIFLDIRLPYMNGIEASKLIKRYDNNIKVVALTAAGSDSYTLAVLFAEADAYYIRDFKQSDLNGVVSNVINEIGDIDRRIQYSLFNYIKLLPKNEYNLLKNDLSILESRFIKLGLIGFSKSEISLSLGSQTSELANYVHSILNKLILAGKFEYWKQEVSYDLF